MRVALALVMTGCAAAAAPAPPVTIVRLPPPSPPAVTNRQAAPASTDEPRHVVRLEEPLASQAVAADPEAPATIVLPESASLSLRVGHRTYALEGDENELVAREDGRIVWRTTYGRVAGGGFELGATPGGGLVLVRFSRGGVRVYQTSDGALVATAKPHVVISPDERFALDPPALEFAQATFDRAEVRKIIFGLPPRVVATLPLPVGKHEDQPFPAFGVAIAPSSAYYAVSYPTELAIYRASDDVKIASYDNPGEGEPTFTKSGRLVVLHVPRMSGTSVFRLDP